MLCPTCGKESTNLRVCGFCQTPYPTDESGKSAASRPARASGSRTAEAEPRRAPWNLSQAQRLAILGVVAAIAAGSYLALRKRSIPAGVALPYVIAGPMSPSDAAATLKEVNSAAEVKVKGRQLSVRISAARFPQLRVGQLALAQEYARADAIVTGSKRVIEFLDPAGKSFAEADPEEGVMLTR